MNMAILNDLNGINENGANQELVWKNDDFGHLLTKINLTSILVTWTCQINYDIE